MTLAPFRPKKATRCRACGQSGAHRDADACIRSLKVAVSRARYEYPARASAYRAVQDAKIQPVPNGD